MPVWTREQQDAIDAKGGTILVSAAAGSGKTAVLVERIIKKIIDKENPVDADKFIVVTFSRAAASEMKQRIEKKLQQLIDEDGNNANYQRQKNLLERAKISTIHGFCADLIRENFHSLDVSGSFRIVQEDETSLLMEETIIKVLEQMYSIAQNNDDNSMLTQGFRILSSMLGSEKSDDNIKTNVFKLYEFIRATAFPDVWLEEKLNYYGEFDDIYSTSWWKVIKDYFIMVVEYCLVFHKRNVESLKLSEDEALKNNYLPAIVDDVYKLEKILTGLQNDDWDSTRTGLISGYTSFGRKKGVVDVELKETIKRSRDKLKKYLEEGEKVFFCGSEKVKEDIEVQNKMVVALCHITKLFKEKIDEVKKEKNILDFTDLEQYALKLLVYKDDNGNIVKTDIAKEIANNYEEILVDEYQDVNDAQNMIFYAVSKDEKNIFMVGDVKQSIYRFRQAMPELFISKRNSYPVFDRENPQFPTTIVLNKNFRSRQEVTQGINFIFEQIMSEEIGEIKYDEYERLNAGAIYPAVEEQRGLSIKMLQLAEDEDEGKSEQEEDESVDVIEAREIGKKIKSLIDNKMQITDNGELRDIQYKDICILMRSKTGHMENYLKELTEMAIPAWAMEKVNFFDTKEIVLALNFLRVIDNPQKDIPFVAVMTSSIYGFSSQELVKIRNLTPKGNIYTAVINMFQSTNDEKCKVILEDISLFRRVSATMPSNLFLQYLFETKNIFPHVKAMGDSKIRVANLRLLIEYAVKYEVAGYKGLTGFIRYIDRILKTKADLEGAKLDSQNDNVVKLMSIHNSKGLEFPVVFLASCSRKFNKKSIYEPLLVHPKEGIGIKSFNSDYKMISDTISHKSIRLTIEMGELSEQLRVLYVALTRAKEKMYIYCTDKGSVFESFLKENAEFIRYSEKINAITVRKCNSFSDLILLSCIKHGSMAKILKESDIEDVKALCFDNLQVERYTPKKDEVVPKEEVELPLFDNQKVELLEQKLGYTYPYKAIANIPLKVSVTQISEKSTIAQRITTRPNFVTSKGLSATEKGNAMHKVMQYANYKNAQIDIKKEVERLVEQKFISSEEMESLNFKGLNAIFGSDLMKRMIKAQEKGLLKREFCFMLERQASLLDDSLEGEQRETPVIVQGIADCIFEEDEKMIIIDYKTDRVQEINQLLERYSGQINLYADAIEKCFGKKVKNKYIYSMHKCEMVQVL